MAGTIGELFVKISADLDEFRKGLDEAKKRLDEFSDEATKKSKEVEKTTGITLKNLTSWVAKLGGAILVARTVANAFDGIHKSQLNTTKGLEGWIEKSHIMIRTIPIIGTVISDLAKGIENVVFFDPQKIRQDAIVASQTASATLGRQLREQGSGMTGSRDRSTELMRLQATAAESKDQRPILELERKKQLEAARVQQEEINKNLQNRIDEQMNIINQDRPITAAEKAESEALIKGMDRPWEKTAAAAQKASDDARRKADPSFRTDMEKWQERRTELRVGGAEQGEVEQEKYKAHLEATNQLFDQKLAKLEEELAQLAKVEAYQKSLLSLNEQIQKNKTRSAVSDVEMLRINEQFMRDELSGGGFAFSGGKMSDIQFEEKKRMLQEGMESQRIELVKQANQAELDGNVNLERSIQKRIEVLHEEYDVRVSLLDLEKEKGRSDLAKSLEGKIRIQQLQNSGGGMELAFETLQQNFQSTLEGFGGVSMIDEANLNRLKELFDLKAEGIGEGGRGGVNQQSAQTAIGTFQFSTQNTGERTVANLKDLLAEFRTFVQKVTGGEISVELEGALE